MIPIVLFYICSATALVLLNKTILAAFGTPFTALWCQSIVSACLARSFSGSNFTDRPLYETLKEQMDLNTIAAASLILSALSLQQVDASAFHTIARSLTIPFTVILAFLFLGSRPTKTSLFGCLLVAAGFASTVGLVFDSSRGLGFTKLGMILGVCAAGVAAMHSVMIKQAVDRKLTDSEMIYYSNVFYVIVGFPLMLLEDLKLLDILRDQESLVIFLAGTGLTGAIAMLFNLAVLSQVKFTSPLTHAISSAFRGVVQSLVSVYALREPFTGNKLTGMVLVTIGTLFYLLGKTGDSKKKAKKV